MLADADLATIAELMSSHRATLLLALIGGSTLSASELSARAGISPSLASAHLSKLLDGGLLAVHQHGRQRHYRLASPHVAEVIEAMLTLAPHRRAASLRDANHGHAIRHARTCYDHLAGTLGVTLTDALCHQHLIEPGDNHYRLTPAGEARLAELGLDVDALRARRRAFARPCLDWTERRPHLAGALGAGIARRMLDLDWVKPVPGTRALRVTDTGRRRLRDELAINLAPSPPVGK
ncbi:MAG: helix-turn-helix transcriptional regulator [Solirubrobacterales bacterium]|nr:helix-turn-helix transcriptional regulator [Solirubrobacterales bacterium]